MIALSRYCSLCAAAGLLMLLGGCSSEPTSGTLPPELLIQGKWEWVQSTSFQSPVPNTPEKCGCTRQIVVTQGEMITLRNGVAIDSAAYTIIDATPGEKGDVKLIIENDWLTDYYRITGRDTLLIVSYFTTDTYVRK